MIKFSTTLLLSLVIISCGGSDNEPPEPTPVEINEVPSVPALIYPTNGLLCIDNWLSFSWEPSIDPNGDAITYRLELSYDNQFTQVFFIANVDDSEELGTLLEKGSAYYWHVKAIDDEGAESAFSPTFSFYTEGDGLTNHLPFAPELVKPTMDEMVEEGNLKLQWTAGDTDGDPLLYDVYFGTENPPTVLFAENQELTFFETDVSSATDYYWRIIVKDDKGGQSQGHIWSFSSD